MYNKFNLTESERNQILNMHKKEGYRQPLNESIDGNNMIDNEKFKNDYYFKKFSEHAQHFQQLADDLIDGASTEDNDENIGLEDKWNKYLMNLKNKDYQFDSSVGREITNDLYGRVLDYPFAEGNSSDNAIGIAIITFMKMGRGQDDIKIVKLMNICKRYYGNDNFNIFTTRKQSE